MECESQTGVGSHKLGGPSLLSDLSLRLTRSRAGHLELDHWCCGHLAVSDLRQSVPWFPRL